MVLSRNFLCGVLHFHLCAEFLRNKKCGDFGEISDEAFDEIFMYFMNALRFKPALCRICRAATCVAIVLQFCVLSLFVLFFFSCTSETFFRVPSTTRTTCVCVRACVGPSIGASVEGDPLALPSNQPEESPEAAAVQQDVGARHKCSKRLKQ